MIFFFIIDRPRFTSCITGQPNSIKAEDQLLFTCLVVGNPRPSLRCDLYGSNGKNLETSKYCILFQGDDRTSLLYGDIANLTGHKSTSKSLSIHQVNLNSILIAYLIYS